MVVRTGSASATAEVAGAVAELVRATDLLVLSGGLGAGKTTFTKAFGAALGVTDPITSPTFTLAREYEGRIPLHHLDVYRLGSIDEVADLGLSELLDGDAVTVIEWGDTIRATLPVDYLEVRIELGPADDDRIIELIPVGPAWSVRRAALASALAPWADAGDGVGAEPGDEPGGERC